MRRRRLKLQLDEKQQLALTLLLVVLVAISLLYCLGLASLALRDHWESLPLPWSETAQPPTDVETVPAVLSTEPTQPP